MTGNELAKQIVDAAYRVHTTLGPGLLESVYESVLAYELEQRGLLTTRQQPVPLVYHGVHIEVGFRVDLIVEDLAIVEIKSVKLVAPVHKKHHPSAASQQAFGFTNKLQRGPDQGRYHERR